MHASTRIQMCSTLSSGTPNVLLRIMNYRNNILFVFVSRDRMRKVTEKNK